MFEETSEVTPKLKSDKIRFSAQVKYKPGWVGDSTRMTIRAWSDKFNINPHHEYS